MLTYDQRSVLARQIVESMRASYEEHGETGDFADGERFLRDEATDQKLQAEAKRWCEHT